MKTSTSLIQKARRIAFIDNAAPAVDAAVVLRLMSGAALDASTMAAVLDSTGVFFTTQLHRLDPVLNLPLAYYTWDRDMPTIPLEIGDERTAFDSLKVLANGGYKPTGKSWVGSKASEVGTVGVDRKRETSPTGLWAEAVEMTVVELAQSQMIGRPLQADLLDAMNHKKNVDLQNQVYSGDTDLGVSGLVNNTGKVTPANVATNAATTSLLWTLKTDDEILADINSLIMAVLTQSAYAIVPDTIGLPPAKLAYLISRKCGANANRSILDYVKENNFAFQVRGVKVNFVDIRELINGGVNGNVDRMIAYKKDRDVVRMPLSQVLSLPPQFVGLAQKVIYYMRIGSVEFKRPEGVAYRDGF